MLLYSFFYLLLDQKVAKNQGQTNSQYTSEDTLCVWPGHRSAAKSEVFSFSFKKLTAIPLLEIFCFIFSVVLGPGCGKVQEQVWGAEKAFSGRGQDIAGIIESPEPYLQAVEKPEQGLRVEKQIGELIFSLQYKPHLYLAIKELGNNASDSAVKAYMESISDMQYYTFRIQSEKEGEELLKHGISNHTEYDMRVQYCAFRMQEDIKLVDGLDTLYCMLFHFERVYGVAPYATFVLGFSTTGLVQDKTLIFEDKLFNSGKIMLTIPKENIVSFE